ncbi:MAG TPA: hypothetical protein VIC26_16795 [Marinagarivorans sp.]
MSIPSEEQLLFEIIEYPNGEIALCRAGEQRGDSEPLVRIQFSEESRYFLEAAAENGAVSVAKVMLEAGLEAVQELQDDADDAQVVSHALH